LRCVGVEPLSERQDVYCLAAPQALLTVNGGLIVSNCDALRYGCMSRPWAAERVEKPKPIVGWEGLTLDQLWEEHERDNRREI
jgi:hypothetical protein